MLVFKRETTINWRLLQKSMKHDDVYTLAKYTFGLDVNPANKIYLFDTEYSNLFMYTADRIMSWSNEPVTFLSLLMIEGELHAPTNVLWAHDNTEFAPVGNEFNQWLNAIYTMQMNQQVENLLRDNEPKSETILPHNEGE